MSPIDVASTARVPESCSTLSVENGSGTGAGLARIVTVLISMRASGTVFLAAVVEIFCATLMPSTTRANTVYCPSSAGWSVTEMKN
jgi:hypothetical protein